MGIFARVRRSAKFKKRPPNLPQYSGYTKLKTIGKMDVIRRKISEAPSTPCENRNLVAAAAAEGDSCEFGSTKYFALCGFGGLLSCGLTHTLVTPLDLVKCRLQVNKESTRPWAMVSNSPSKKEVLAAFSLVGHLLLLATLCKVSASLASMKYLKTYTAACWAKKIHTCTELLCTWRPQPPLNSLLTLLCPPWSLLRCEFKQVRSVLSQLP